MEFIYNEEKEVLNRGDEMNLKQISCWVVLLLMFLLAGATNEIPDAFIDRIFVPLHGGNWSFHYAGIVLIIIVYTCFRQLNLQKESVLLKTGWRRMIATFVFISLSQYTSIFTTQIQKSFSHDLTSIYLDRSESNVSVMGSETELKLEGQLKLKNCSDEEQRFYIKISMPTFVEEVALLDEVILNQVFTLPAKTTQSIMIDETMTVQMSGYHSFHATAYEYMLLNEKSEIIFKGSFDQYLLN